MPPTRRRPLLAGVLAGAVFASALHAAPAAQGRGGDVNSPIDLVMLQCLMPKQVQIGKKFRLMDEIENAGTAAAPESVTIYFVSADDVLDEKDLPIRGRRVPPLQAGQSESYPVTVSIDADLPPGTYYLLAVADARRQVTERLEGNNIKATQFTLLPRK